MGNTSEPLDIAIVGAGWHGLSMAKTFQEVVENAQMMVFDGAQSIGGTWAKERLYPGLKTNNLLGTYEFSDFPMTPGRFDVQPGHHIPGHAVHDYLVQFAEHFDLTPKIQLSSKVESARVLDDGTWELCLISTGSGQSSPKQWRVIARRLVVATGLTSEPFMPRFEGEEKFGQSLFHAIELRERADEIENARQVVVLGGNKSAWDTCFFAAQSGAKVHMVIRPGGGGPSWVWPVLFSPFKVSIQRLAATRFFTWFDPCIWAETDGPVGWVRRMLHGTYLGRKLVSAFWRILESFANTAHRYDDHPGTQRLKPWVSPFWMGNSLSIHNYATPWFDLVREGKITVHIADVKALSASRVHLTNGEIIQADAFVCCTGWHTSPPIKFLPEGIESSLGLGGGPDAENCELIKKARAQIYTSLPSVQGSPRRRLPAGTVGPKNDTTAPPSNRPSHAYRLYRFLVPPEERFFRQRQVAFIGSHLALNATMIAQLQALWITAFFTDKLPHLAQAVDFDRVRYETVLHSEYSRIRHPRSAGGAGDRCPDLAFECLSYMDLLAMDLGLKRYRKVDKGGWFSEVMHRYGPSDFKNVVREWMALGNL